MSLLHMSSIDMKVLQTTSFRKTCKKLHKNQKSDLDKAVRAIIKDLYLGDLKKGDLSTIRVYKFKMNKQLNLLAYTFQEDVLILTLIALGSHENFYRDLSK